MCDSTIEDTGSGRSGCTSGRAGGCGWTRPSPTPRAAGPRAPLSSLSDPGEPSPARPCCRRPSGRRGCRWTTARLRRCPRASRAAIRPGWRAAGWRGRTPWAAAPRARRPRACWPARRHYRSGRWLPAGTSRTLFAGTWGRPLVGRII